MNNTQQLFSIIDASKIMGIGRTRIYQEINNNRLEARKCGNRTLIPFQAIDKWISQLPNFQTEKDQ